MQRPPGPVPASAPARRGLPDAPDPAAVDEVLWCAFAEDLGLDLVPDFAAPRPTPAALLERDLTTRVAVPPGARARAGLLAKADGVLAGLGVFRRAFELLDPELEFRALAQDGERIERGQSVAELEGSARALLVAERTALNLLQRMSGVASLAAEFVERAGRGARRVGREPRVLDTRKTTPGLRLLQKYAVRCGGAENHRYGLYDEVMLKDNHADWSSTAEATAPERLAKLVSAAREDYGSTVRITAEARDLAQALAALEAGADVLLLDNFSPQELEPVCAGLRARAAELGSAVELEASGGIDLETVEAFAASGVDRLSVGALTHSAIGLDLSLEVVPLGAPAGGAR